MESVVPNSFCNSGATILVQTSVGPPAAKLMTTSMGLLGYFFSYAFAFPPHKVTQNTRATTNPSDKTVCFFISLPPHLWNHTHPFSLYRKDGSTESRRNVNSGRRSLSSYDNGYKGYHVSIVQRPVHVNVGRAVIAVKYNEIVILTSNLVAESASVLLCELFDQVAQVRALGQQNIPPASGYFPKDSMKPDIYVHDR